MPIPKNQLVMTLINLSFIFITVATLRLFLLLSLSLTNCSHHDLHSMKQEKDRQIEKNESQEIIAILPSHL